MAKYFSKPMTHGRLKDVLLSLGFRWRTSPAQYSEKLGFTLPEAVVYKHDEAGAMIILPVHSLDAKRDEAYRDAASQDAQGFGIMRLREKFNAMLTQPAEPAQTETVAPQRKRVKAAA